MTNGSALMLLMNAVYDQRYTRERLRTLVDALHLCTKDNGELHDSEPVGDELRKALVEVMAADLKAADRIVT